MTTYQQSLIAEGFPASRVKDIEEAMDKLHTAICRLDTQNYCLFRTKTLGQRFAEYCESDPCLRKFLTLE